MKRYPFIVMLTGLIVTGGLPQRQLVAADPQQARQPKIAEGAESTRIADIRLGNEESFSGILIDEQGRALAGLPVVLSFKGVPVARIHSESDGRFVVRKVRTGVHTVTVGVHQWPCRCWTSQAAPGAAQQRAVLVFSEEMVRGQSWLPGRCSNCGQFLCDGNCDGGFETPGTFHNPEFLAIGLAGTVGVVGGVIGFNKALDRRAASR